LGKKKGFPQETPHKTFFTMNHETYDDIVKTEDFSMISTIEEGKK
jgi:hypothetical protein